MGRKIVLTGFFLFFILAVKVLAQVQLSKPETIVYDSSRNRYIVSNFTTGDLIQIDRYGSYTLYYSGLDTTMGLHIDNNILYVASNFNPFSGVVAFDLNADTIIAYYTAPSVQFCNDITTDTSGNLYFTDTFLDWLVKINLTDGTPSLLLNGNIHYPNGLHFDARKNRLFIASNVSGSAVFAFDLATQSLYPATVTYGQFDGFGDDNLYNLYVSWSGAGTIYRFDSTLDNPGEIISSGHDQPEGIYFNKLTSTLCVPNMFGNTIDFLPFDIDMWHTADTTFGWSPLEVNFEGNSVYNVSQWIWDFGDGDSAYVQSPSHIFDTPGLYDVKMTVVTSSSDTITRLYPNYIFNLADTLSAGAQEIGTEVPFEVVLNLKNTVPIGNIKLGIQWSGEIDLVYDSISTESCRTDYYESFSITKYNASLKKMFIEMIPRTNGLPLYMSPGEGAVLKVYFHAEGSVSGKETQIAFIDYDDTHKTSLTTSGGVFEPALRNGLVKSIGCCTGQTGNADCSESDIPDISDITRLIDYLYISHNPLCCDEESDVDSSGGEPDISDITRLIDNLYISHQPLPICS